MALFNELLVADLSGKVGANVFSHNAGGKYVRVLSIPTNPNTPQQAAVRSAFALLTSQWFNILTAVQRLSWEVYAKAVPVINRIGNSVKISGLSMFVRNNTAKAAFEVPAAFDAPTDFTGSVALQATPQNATEAAQTIDFPFSNVPAFNPWVEEVGSLFIAYVARPQNASIKFFKGPYRFAGFVQGDPVPPVGPLTVAAPFPFVAGQKIFTRQFIAQIDGRISGSFRSDLIAGA